MIEKGEILEILESFFKAHEVFFVDLKISQSGKISLMIDRHEGMTIDLCVDASRVIKSHFGERLDNCELMVSSPGLDQPFMVKEQYVKNLNKDIKVLLKTGETFEGNLVTVSDDEIVIKIKGDKKIKKGQKPDLIEKIIKNEEIKSTKSVIKI